MSHQADEGHARSSSGPQTWLDLLDDDYEHAVLRLVSDHHRKTKAQTLVCATVELLPKEIPPPASQPPRSIELSKNHFLYTHDVTISARRGLEWYRDCARGLALRPGTDGILGCTMDPDAVILKVQPLSEEPIWPNLVTSTLEEPFHGDAFHSSRVHHLIPDSFELWTDKEREQAREWLDQTMHFDFGVFPEYWGSVHLYVPNPLFRSLSTRIGPNGLDMALALQPRRGRSVSGLVVMFEEERPTGVSADVAITAGPIVRFLRDQRVGGFRARVVDKTRGVLYEGQLRAIPGSFNATTRLSGGERRVRVPGEGGSPDEEYTVHQRGEIGSESKKPPPSRNDGAQVLSKAKHTRQRRSRGEAEQRWFRDQAADGIAELRKLIGSASNELWIWVRLFCVATITSKDSTI